MLMSIKERTLSSQNCCLWYAKNTSRSLQNYFIQTAAQGHFEAYSNKKLSCCSKNARLCMYFLEMLFCVKKAWELCQTLSI